jgi:hypothetical protein
MVDRIDTSACFLSGSRLQNGKKCRNQVSLYVTTGGALIASSLCRSTHANNQRIRAVRQEIFCLELDDIKYRPSQMARTSASRLTAIVIPYRKDKCTPFTFLLIQDNNIFRNQKIGYHMLPSFRHRWRIPDFPYG